MNNPTAVTETTAAQEVPAAALTLPQRWILHRFSTYARACLIAVTFLVPVVVDAAALDQFFILKLTTVFVFTICGLALSVSFVFERKRRAPRPATGVAIAVFLLTMIMATAFSEAPSVSIIGLYHRYGGLIPYLLYVAVAFVVLLAHGDQPSRLFDIAWASAAASLVVSVYVLIQAAGLDWTRWIDASTQGLSQYPASTMGNSNFAGGYLAIVIPLVVGAALMQHRRIARWALLTTAALDGLALLLTGSRGGLIAVAAAGLATTFIARPRLPRRLVKATGALSLAAGIMVVLLVWHPGFKHSPVSVAHRGTSTLESRLDYWLSAIRIVRKHPLTGTGPDTYYAHYARERLRAEALRNPLQIPDKPHNVFLEHAVNGGIAEGFSFLLVFGLALYYVGRRAHQLQGTDLVLALAGFAALVAYCVQAFFSIDEPPLAVLGWILVGWTMVVADPKVLSHRVAHLEAVNVVPSSTSGPTRPAIRWLVHSAVLATAATLLFYGVRPLLADVRGRNGQLDRSIQLNPLEASYLADRGDLSLAVADASLDRAKKLKAYQDAEHDYRKALDLRPEYFLYIRKVAIINSKWGSSLDPGRFAIADSWWRRATAENRYDRVVADDYERFRNEIAAVAVQSEQLALADPGSSEKWAAAAEAYAVAGNPEHAKSLAARALSVDPANKRASDLLSRLPH